MSSETKRGLSRPTILVLLVIVLVAGAAALFFMFDRLANRQQVVNTGAAIVESGDVFDGGTVIDPPREVA
ncbi:MAG: hypothetical protein K8I30_07715, partial [Anaerolineae bacterium]|nr:hypothetical protein [Anaerolineae bacterium]